MPLTSKITSKGQVTIPKYIRDLLNSNVIEFEVRDGVVLIKPVKSVGGSLRKYAKNTKPIHEIREKVWSDVSREKSEK